MTELKTLKELYKFRIIKFESAEEELNLLKKNKYSPVQDSKFYGQCAPRDVKGNPIKPNSGIMVDTGDLKQEAIKWIKSLKLDVIPNTERLIEPLVWGDVVFDCEQEIDAAKDILMIFFNITEEDLK